MAAGPVLPAASIWRTGKVYAPSGAPERSIARRGRAGRPVVAGHRLPATVLEAAFERARPPRPRRSKSGSCRCRARRARCRSSGRPAPRCRACRRPWPARRRCRRRRSGGPRTCTCRRARRSGRRSVATSTPPSPTTTVAPRSRRHSKVAPGSPTNVQVGGVAVGRRGRESIAGAAGGRCRARTQLSAEAELLPAASVWRTEKVVRRRRARGEAVGPRRGAAAPADTVRRPAPGGTRSSRRPRPRSSTMAASTCPARAARSRSTARLGRRGRARSRGLRRRWCSPRHRSGAPRRCRPRRARRRGRRSAATCTTPSRRPPWRRGQAALERGAGLT